ncbi:MAG: glycoside hydrolase family 15 protein, partial [Terriglobia bacterium]
MSQQSIGDYGIIGNLRTVALVGKNGSIDWLCYPRFDSPSVFGAILDSQKGGSFSIAPIVPAQTHEQRYWPDTNVLITGFISAEGSGEVIDFMPLAREDEPEGQLSIIRRVKVVRGVMAFRIKCHPAFDYGRAEHRAEFSGQGVVFRSSGLSLSLATSVPLKVNENGVEGEFTLKEGEAATFILRGIAPGEGCAKPLGEEESLTQIKQTVEYWQRWISKCTYKGRWRETVQRSALALELLVYEPTGAVVAAPTCSLPEKIGGQRNWDYRYSWIRDSSFTVYALLRIGLTDEADRFMEWLKRLCSELQDGGSLQTVYGIDGRRKLSEETLDHCPGYQSSRPVRIGNRAYEQLQLDIYGELMDAVYLYNKYRNPISSELWDDLRRLANWVCVNWQLEDQGLWEMRGSARHFVYSKVMCWVALDRVIRIAQNRSLPAPWDKWLRCRDEIYEQ